MQQDIIFKIIDDKVNIIATSELSYDKFLQSLKKRLDNLYIKDDLLKANIILDIRNISLDAKKILSIFDVLAVHENIYINKIIYKESNNKNIILHEGSIRGGEIRLFSSNTLLIGNINKGAKVIVNGDFYVIGKICGMLEFKGINNKLMAASVEDVFIKICALEKKFEGIKENITIRVEGNEIIEENFMDRREKRYGKSNCGYIW